MKKHKTFTVGHRRKREGKTDYKRRLKLLLSGKPRLAVRLSLNDITAQIIDYNEKGDKVLVSLRASSLKQFGWQFNNRNISSAYLLGLFLGKKAQEKGVKEAILDIGLQKSVPGSRLFSVLKGALDSGLTIPHSDNVLPKEERIQGKHIEEYAQKLKENPELYNKKFGEYLKKGLDPLHISEVFTQTKNKIMGAQ